MNITSSANAFIDAVCASDGGIMSVILGLMLLASEGLAMTRRVKGNGVLHLFVCAMKDAIERTQASPPRQPARSPDIIQESSSAHTTPHRELPGPAIQSHLEHPRVQDIKQDGHS
jgi:hypothetical protein